MAATLSQISALAAESRFRARVMAACVHQAMTAGKQAAASKKIFDNCEVWTTKFAAVVADDTAVNTAAYASGSLNVDAILDSDIQNAVNNAWAGLVYQL